jgi:hypothetical protein
MSFEEEYIALNQRLASLGRQHAVLTAQEEEKTARREELIKALTAAGIDVNRPEEEKARLQSEVDQALKKAKEELDLFEKQLTLDPTPEIKEKIEEVKAPTPTTAQPTPEPTLAVEDDDIDI